MSAGYTGTPLARKLGVKDGQRSWRLAMPESVAAGIDATPLLLDQPEAGLEMAHVFTTRRVELEAELMRLRQLIDPAGVIWVSWPKKAAKVDTDITEDVIRAVALPMGFVDVKVCAVDTVWSGLKLMIRRELR